MKQSLLVLCTVLFVTGCAKKESVKDSRPNVIIIFTDDHAKNAVSAYGSKLISTPNIDRIGKEGVRFSNAFATNSLCGPSRAVILTGKYSHINGFRDNNDHFDGSQMTFPKLLKAAGYFTSIVGKWHLGSVPEGFDYWNILIDQGSYYNPEFVEMGDTSRREGYVTDLTTDYALETLSGRPQEKPFLMMLHQKAPHRNWLPDFKHLELFANDTFPLPSNFYDDYSTRSAAAREQQMEIKDMFMAYDMKLFLPEGMDDPGTGGHAGANGAKMWNTDYNRFTPAQKEQWDHHYKPLSEEFFKINPKGKQLEGWMYQQYIRDYLRCVVSVDENVGRVFDYLEENKILDNTIIIYASDQGFFLGEHGWYDKRFMYEESLGIPLMIRFPPMIKAGKVNEQIVLNLDIGPTILDAAGITVPDDFQGRSLLPLMAGEPVNDWRTAMYYHYYEYPYGAHKVKRHYGIRTDRYKLIHFYNDIDAWELYDLEADPKEMNNHILKKEYVTLVDSLKSEMEKLRRQYKDTTGIVSVKK